MEGRIRTVTLPSSRPETGSVAVEPDQGCGLLLVVVIHSRTVSSYVNGPTKMFSGARLGTPPRPEPVRGSGPGGARRSSRRLPGRPAENRLPDRRDQASRLGLGRIGDPLESLTGLAGQVVVRETGPQFQGVREVFARLGEIAGAFLAVGDVKQTPAG